MKNNFRYDVRDDMTFDSWIQTSTKFRRLQNLARNSSKLSKGGCFVYIHGPVSTGKTHLLNAIVNEMRRRNPKAPAWFFSADQLPESWKPTEALIVDDLHFIQGKTKAQGCVLRYARQVLKAGGSVFIAGLTAPKNFHEFTPGLRTLLDDVEKFALSKVTPHVLEAILKEALAKEHVSLPKNIVKSLAPNLVHDPRAAQMLALSLRGTITSLRSAGFELDFSRGLRKAKSG